jgi:hypothetical protein
MPQPKRRFAVALSFPGQHRKFVRNVAESLADSLGRKRVFFDEWYQPELMGSGADLKLKRIYGKEAELVVPFFSEHYSKMWCQVEWHSIRAVLAERRQDDAVVPVHLDATRVEGWETIDFGIVRKAGQSGQAIASALLAVYQQRRPRALRMPAGEPQPSEEPNTSVDLPAGRAKTRRSNARPQTVVLMDSTLPDVVYDENTRQQGGTNADDITDILSDLPVQVIKETTSLMWRRDEQVLRLSPDLIVVHFSAFYDTTNADDGDQRLEDFLKYLSNGTARFLIYSRMSPEQVRWLDDWITRIEAQTPALRGRLHTMPIERGPGATFRNAVLARRLKLRVKELLEL